MKVKLLYDYIDPEKGVIPNLEPIFGSEVSDYPPLWEYIDDKEIVPSYLGADEEGWFYPIHINRSTHYVDEVIISPGKWEKHSHFWRKIPQKVQEGIINNKGWVLLNFYEPMSKEFQDSLVSVINEKRVTTYYNNVTIPYDRFLVISVNKVEHPNFINLPLTDIFTVQKAIKDKRFEYKDYACFVKNYFKSKHRVNIIRMLGKLGLLDKGYVSFDPRNKKHINLPEEVLHYVDINLVVEAEQELCEDKNSLASIINITEKSYRSFLLEKPFLIFAQPTHLKYLKSLGFKTFDCIFNENYDLEYDNNKRLYGILKNLHWWTNLSMDEKKYYLEIAKPVIKHNKDLLEEIMSSKYLKNKLLEYVTQ